MYLIIENMSYLNIFGSKKEMNNFKFLLSRILVVFFALLVIVDVVYFFKYRLEPNYHHRLVAWSYESIERTLIRWFLCLIAIFGIVKINKSISIYLMVFTSVGIILLSIIKGRLYYLLQGSFVFNLWLFELAAISEMYFVNSGSSKPKILYLVVFILGTISLFVLLSNMLPGVQVYSKG